MKKGLRDCFYIFRCLCLWITILSLLVWIYLIFVAFHTNTITLYNLYQNYYFIKSLTLSFIPTLSICSLFSLIIFCSTLSHCSLFIYLFFFFFQNILGQFCSYSRKWKSFSWIRTEIQKFKISPQVRLELAF